MSTRHNRRLLLTLATATTASAAAGACSLPGFGPSTPPPVPLAEQQILRLNMGGEPETIDPARVSYTGELGIVMRVFSNLLALDASGKLVPEMAEKLPDVSADGRTLTFTLRRDLKYSDGRPLVARDFERAWQRHLDPRTSGEYAYLGHIVEGGEALATARERDDATLDPLRRALGVRAKDDRTLEFRLATAAPWFLSVLTTWCGVPVREDLAGLTGARWTDPATYVGNGPYVLREWDRGNRMVLEANPNYYLGPPTLNKVELSMGGDAAVQLAAYRNGELDVLNLQREDLDTVQGDPQLRKELQQFPGSCTTYLGFNATKPPFDKAAARRAFSLALDRDAWAKDALGGIAAPAAQLVPPQLPGHYADLKPQRRDPAAARRALAEAGYTDPRAVPAVRFTYAGGARSRARVESLVQQLRAALEVEVLADPVDSRTFAAMTRSPETAPQLFQLGWCQDYPDPQTWYSTLFHSRSTQSRTGWSHRDYDRLVEQADAERDPRIRSDLYHKAAQLLMDEAPVAVLSHSAVARVVKPWVNGLGQHPAEHYEGQATLMKLRILKH